MFSPAILGSDGLRVSRMRMRSSDPDGLRARQRIEAQLFGLGAASLGLPPQALLFVKRLTARAAPPHAATGDNAMAHGVGRELGRFAQIARRPWIHADAPHADAVLFADEAELIACLIRDWLRGLVRDRWWWPSVLNGAGVEPWMRQYVLTRGDALVPALSLLDPDREVVRVIARLPASDVRVAVVAVARAFALPAVVAGFPTPSPMRGERAEADAAAPADAVAVTARARAALGRLMATVPEIRSPALDGEQRRLAVVVLVVARSLAWTRTSEFEETMTALASAEFNVDAVVNSLPAVRRLERPAQPATPDAVLRTVRTVPVANEGLPCDRVADMVNAAAAPSTPAAGSAIAARSKSRRRLNTTAPSPAERPVTKRPRAARDVKARRAPQAAVLTPAAGDSTPWNHAEWPTPSARAEDVSSPTVATSRVETEYGGIFYLLNAWLAMGLYSDFTAPRGPNLALSPWDLLALVGREWFGEPFVADRVWTLLADLAVRDPDAEPGCDVDLQADWLEQHLETLGRRLEEALGWERVNEIPALVCCHHASIDVTAGSMHLHLSLGELPLAVRISGLDRDPGWIPAAGRAVAFHFA